MGYTEVEIVRHGSASHMDTPDIIAGWAPYSTLTDEGIQQAEALGESWRQEGIKFDLARTSPIIRAIDTLRIAQTAAGLELHAEPDPGFAEHCLGAHEGKLRSSVYTPYLRWMIELQGALFKHQGKNSVGAPGETSLQVCRRMADSVALLHEQADSDRPKIVVASHQVAIKSLINYIAMGGQQGSVDPLELKKRIVDPDHIPVNPCSRTLLIIEDGPVGGLPLIKVECIGKPIAI